MEHPCSECTFRGLSSEMSIRESMDTEMACPKPFYDSNGRYHDHDGNTTTTTYVCTNGHYSVFKTKRVCSGCGTTR